MTRSSKDDQPSVWRRLGVKYRNEIGLALATLLVLAVAAAYNDSYLEKPAVNAQEILKQTSLLGIFALGAAIVIISGGIDLSSGSVIAFSGSVCALTMLWLAPVDENGLRQMENVGWDGIALAMLAALLVGVAIGTFHAWLITAIRLPPFVATLASLVGLRSLARVLNKAVTASFTEGDSVGATKITIYNDRLESLDVWWAPLVVFLVLSFLAWVLMTRTIAGRHLIAMGGNEEAARLSGIRTDRLKWLAYGIGAATASIAGVLYTAKIGSVDPVTMGLGYELNAIAAAVVGGCSLQGGVGLIPGVMLGVLFLRVVIHSVTKIIRVSPDEYEGLIVGLLIVLAVAFNAIRQQTSSARKAFFPGPLGWAIIPVLAMLIGTVAFVMSQGAGNNLQIGQAAGLATLVILGSMKIMENRRARTN